MYTTCYELGIFIYSTGHSMNNLSSYCGLVNARIRASDKVSFVSAMVLKTHLSNEKYYNFINAIISSGSMWSLHAWLEAITYRRD